MLEYEKSLAYLKPELAAEWDYERNEELLPIMVTVGSNRKIFWKCIKGHSWAATIVNRTRHKKGCPYCAGMKPIVGETDLSSTFPEIVEEWDYEKNGNLTPEMVRPGSHKKAYWKCKKGHSWKAIIYSRTHSKKGCPYCSGRKPIAGETDLASKFPEIVSEWDYDKNGELLPIMFTVASSRKVYWKCPKGHSWLASICSRTKRSSGCPYCVGRMAIAGETDLASKNPELVKEWNYEKNFDCKPDMYTEYSPKKVWWICGNGHEWVATIKSRSKGSNCPYCSRSISN